MCSLVQSGNNKKRKYCIVSSPLRQDLNVNEDRTEEIKIERKGKKYWKATKYLETMLGNEK